MVEHWPELVFYIVAQVFCLPCPLACFFCVFSVFSLVHAFCSALSPGADLPSQDVAFLLNVTEEL